MAESTKASLTVPECFVHCHSILLMANNDCIPPLAFVYLSISRKKVAASECHTPQWLEIYIDSSHLGNKSAQMQSKDVTFIHRPKSIKVATEIN